MKFRKSPPAAQPRTLMDWVALSSMTKFPKATGNARIDTWNEAITCAQSYLNGRAISAESDEDKERLLRLRADLNWLHMTPSEAEEPPA